MTDPIPTFDLYELLEVSSTASMQTIEAAWRSLMKRNHPDLGGKGAEERARRLNIAHDWLTDPGRRAHYDRALTDASRRAAAARSTSAPYGPSGGMGQRPVTAVPSSGAMRRWRLALFLALALMPIGGLGGWTDLFILGGVLAGIFALFLIVEGR